MLKKLIVTCIFSGLVSAQQYVHWGKSSREEELACAWSGKNSKACNKIKKRADKVILQVGEAYAVDDFLLPEEFAWLGAAYQDKKYTRAGNSLNATYDRVDEVSSDFQSSFEELVQRIHGHAMIHLGSQSAFSEFGWAYNGEYFPDDATLRKYDRKKSAVQHHQDSGAYGRCLSATLHTGQVSGIGGDIETYTCRTGNCSIAGWQHDDKRFPSPPPELLRLDNLKKRVSLKYKPGRLVYFLAETVHAVTPVENFDRHILFIWFSCTPTFANGNIKAGHMALVEHLVKEGADVNIISPDSQVTPAYFAAVSGHVPILSYLDKLGAPMDIPDIFGRTPVHIGSEHGFLAVTRYLTNLDSRVDAKRPGADGLTPLMLAAKNGHVSVAAHLLLQEGDTHDPSLLRIASERGHCSMLLFLAKWTTADVCYVSRTNASLLHHCSKGLKSQARDMLTCKKPVIDDDEGDEDDEGDDLGVPSSKPAEFGIEKLCPDELDVPESGKLTGPFPLNATHLKFRDLKVRICERRTKESAGILAIEGMLDVIGGAGLVRENNIPSIDEEIVNLLGRDLVISQVYAKGRHALRVARPTKSADALHHHRIHHPPSKESPNALYASVVTFLNDEFDGLHGGHLLFPTLARPGQELDGAQQELSDSLHEKYDSALQNAEEAAQVVVKNSPVVDDMCARTDKYFTVKPRLGLTLLIWHAVGKRKGPYRAEAGEHWHTDCAHDIQKITLERFVYLRTKYVP